MDSLWRMGCRRDYARLRGGAATVIHTRRADDVLDDLEGHVVGAEGAHGAAPLHELVEAARLLRHVFHGEALVVEGDVRQIHGQRRRGPIVGVLLVVVGSFGLVIGELRNWRS